MVFLLYQPWFKDLSGYCGGAGSRTPCRVMDLHAGTRPSRRPALQVWLVGVLWAKIPNGDPWDSPGLSAATPRVSSEGKSAPLKGRKITRPHVIPE